MNFRTLFRAYSSARKEMEFAVAARWDGNHGIAVASDTHARDYQRYSRLAQRIEWRIEGVKVCPICTVRADAGFHFSNCRHYVKDLQS